MRYIGIFGSGTPRWGVAEDGFTEKPGRKTRQTRPKLFWPGFFGRVFQSGF
jgi:hypothetical protein